MLIIQLSHDILRKQIENGFHLVLLCAWVVSWCGINNNEIMFSNSVGMLL